MITAYIDDADIVYEVDWGRFRRLGKFFTERVPNFFQRWADGWYPGKLVFMIVTEGMLNLTTRVANFAVDWAHNGPERIGRYFEELFYFADDATQAQKAATVVHGVGTLFKSIWDSPLATRAIQTAIGSVGVNPQVGRALQSLVSQGWDAVGARLYGTDYEANRAYDDGEYEALVEERVAKFADYMEGEGIPMGALKPPPEPPAGWSKHPERPLTQTFLTEEPLTQTFLTEEPLTQTFLTEEPITQTFLYDDDDQDPLPSEVIPDSGRMGALVLGAGALAFMAMKR